MTWTRYLAVPLAFGFTATTGWQMMQGRSMIPWVVGAGLGLYVLDRVGAGAISQPTASRVYQLAAVTQAAIAIGAIDL